MQVKFKSYVLWVCVFKTRQYTSLGDHGTYAGNLAAKTDVQFDRFRYLYEKHEFWGKLKDQEMWIRMGKIYEEHVKFWIIPKQVSLILTLKVKGF